VLIASSDYFAMMFSGALRESKENEVKLEEVQGDILRALVEYCYTGHVGLCPDNVQELLMASHLFQLNPIVARCSDYLEQDLQPSNCLGIYKLADRYSLMSLLEMAENYTNDHFSEVRSILFRLLMLT